MSIKKVLEEIKRAEFEKTNRDDIYIRRFLEITVHLAAKIERYMAYDSDADFRLRVEGDTVSKNPTTNFNKEGDYFVSGKIIFTFNQTVSYLSIYPFVSIGSADSIIDSIAKRYFSDLGDPEVFLNGFESFVNDVCDTYASYDVEDD